MLNFDWISGLDLSIAKILILSVFVLQFIFILFLKKDYIFAGAPDRKNWRNLKIWVLILSAIMITIYTIF